MYKKYYEHIRSLGVSVQRTPFSKKLLTCQDVAKDLGIDVAQVAKSMVIIRSNGYAFIAVLPGNQHLSLKKLRTIIGAAKKEIHLADENEIEECLGLTIGAVTPLIKIHKAKVQVIIDSKLIKFDKVNISSGDLSMGLNIDPKELISLLGARVGNLCRD